MHNEYWVIFLVSVFIASCAQIILKSSANNHYENYIQEYLNIKVIGAYLLLLTSTVLTIIAYRGVELKVGPILESSGYVFVLLLSYVFLKEKISIQKIIGLSLIIAGIMVSSY